MVFSWIEYPSAQHTSLSALLPFKVSVEKTAVILMDLPLYVIWFFFFQPSLSVLCACCFNDNMLWRGSTLVKSVWCPGGFLYLNHQNILQIWEIFCYYFIGYIMYPFGLYLFSFFNAHDSQVWSLDGLTEFLHIPFTALELFD
jgi:hypothetical protein